MSAKPTAFSLWIEEMLAGWVLPVAGLSLLAILALLYVTGVATEEVTAAIAVVLVALAASLLMARAALGQEGAARWLPLVAAVATLLAVVLPAVPTVWPGKPLFEGELGVEGDRVSVPAGVGGRIRLLVTGKLRGSGEPSASYVISGAQEPIEGRLERTYGYSRIGRSGRARVAHDHVGDWYDAQLPAGLVDLTLQRLNGQLGGRLAVSAYRAPVPLPGGSWGLAALALVVAAVAEARAGRKNGVAVPAGMALAFGLLVTYNATPLSAVGPVVGGVLLGALAGSLVGWIAAAIARRVLAPPAAKPVVKPVARPTARNGAS
jgi:hypothetical protein